MLLSGRGWGRTPQNCRVKYLGITCAIVVQNEEEPKAAVKNYRVKYLCLSEKDSEK